MLEWVVETWRLEVGRLVGQEPDPVLAPIALARGHAVYCRRDVARVAMALRQAGHDELLAARAAVGVLGLHRLPDGLA